MVRLLRDPWGLLEIREKIRGGSSTYYLVTLLLVDGVEVGIFQLSDEDRLLAYRRGATFFMWSSPLRNQSVMETARRNLRICSAGGTPR